MKRHTTLFSVQHLKIAGNFFFALLLVIVASLTVFLVQKFQQQEPPASTIQVSILSPGTALPDEAECTSRVHLTSKEARPDNTTANNHVPTTQQISDLAPWGSANGLDPKADAFRKQITGNYTGTTDDIIQWAACKWGIDADLIRAEAIAESNWHQNQTGDWTTDKSLCPPGEWNGTGCFQSYGMLQIKYIYNTTAWPMSRDDTAFNVEYAYGIIRTCFEGWATYLAHDTPLPGYPSYHAGDIWGCIGRWYSGAWYDQSAINYINSVKAHLQNKEWLEQSF